MAHAIARVPDDRSPALLDDRFHKNALSVKEHVARECILGAIGDALWNPGALEHIRERVAGRLGDLSRALDAEAKGAARPPRAD